MTTTDVARSDVHAEVEVDELVNQLLAEVPPDTVSAQEFLGNNSTGDWHGCTFRLVTVGSG